ncbi:hypothetical protein [Haloferula sargassicola]|uniref:Fibronectin type-III domain-containing protein n=1 Tax=Haloferula sargassicola TaxID=490096 RepID=A0ABP9UL90_9BACT
MSDRNLVLLLSLLGLPAMAETVSVNFVGNAGAGGSVAAGDTAGVAPAAHWNDVTTSGSALVDDSGAASPITVTFSVGGWANPENGGDSPDARLMKGYLDIGGPGATTVTLNGLDPAKTYRVYLYSDGQNASFGEPVSRTGTFVLGGITTGITDTAGEQFEGAYQRVYPGTTGEGNYTDVNLTGSASYSISIRGSAADGLDNLFRAPLNALQIVAVAE